MGAVPDTVRIYQINTHPGGSQGSLGAARCMAEAISKPQRTQLLPYAAPGSAYGKQRATCSIPSIPWGVGV